MDEVIAFGLPAVRRLRRRDPRGQSDEAAGAVAANVHAIEPAIEPADEPAVEAETVSMTQAVR